jgi:hypothetical protein
LNQATSPDCGTPVDDGGHAFPMPSTAFQIGNPGMTKREWYAGMFMAGMAANPQWNDTDWADMAEQAFIAADAMIEHGKP